jgi:phosphate starvation-inducible protein PhoH and related proteins
MYVSPVKDKKRVKVEKKFNFSMYPKTEAQRRYIEQMTTKDVVIAEGPAGTGKTYLAISFGIQAVIEGTYERLIITRRAIEADEDKIGFVPGDKHEKLHDYMRPSIDVICDHMGVKSSLQSVLATDMVEIEHLGSLRGRTFNKCFMVLDEAQNTTENSMYMFLTRIGMGSKAIVCGDLTQNDLPKHKKSGLVVALESLQNAKRIGIQRFEEEDIQRSEAVKTIIRHWPKN